MHAPLQHKPKPRTVHSRTVPWTARNNATGREKGRPHSRPAPGFDLSRIPIYPDGVQPKLTISQPGDRSEQEADRIADRIMTMPEPRVQRQADEEEEEVWVFRGEIMEHDPMAPFMGVMTKSPAVHTNPRFIKLLRDMKLDYWADKYSQPEV